LVERLPSLIEAGVVEQLGSGRGARTQLSRELCAAVGRGGAYTRRTGPDHETNKKLLLQRLMQNGQSGAPLAELCQVPPALSISSVQRLLREMRREGLVGVQGGCRWARWYASKGQDLGAV
jgi:ATP-dependent DNA helicase RecG